MREREATMPTRITYIAIIFTLMLSALAIRPASGQPMAYGDFTYKAVRAVRPSVGFKTNALYWATSSPNVAMEFATGKKWTVNTTLGFNAWDFDPLRNDEISLRHWLVQPELRYWFCQAFEGHVVGVHGIYTNFDVGNILFLKGEIAQYIYRGYGYGAGVSYGYHFPLAQRWGVELTAGFGFLILDYDKYNCLDCEEFLGSFGRNYVGPTKLAVNFVFMFN